MRHVDVIGTIVVPPSSWLLSAGASSSAGETGSGQLLGAAQAASAHGLGGRRGAGRQPGDGAALGAAAQARRAAAANFFSVPLRLMSEAGIVVNLVFMFLNLLPILPLDGGRILASLLPSRAAWQYAKLEPWGVRCSAAAGDERPQLRA